MSDITWPLDLPPLDATFWLEPNSFAQSSPLNRTEQVIELPGELWRTELTFDAERRGSSARMDALLARGRGMAGAFLVPPFRRADRFEALAGVTSVLVNGADQSGRTLNTKGWTPSAPALQEGDYLQVGEYFGIITATVAADAGGLAALSVEPAIWPGRSPEDEAAVVVSWPRCRMRLVDNRQSVNRTRFGLFSDYALSFVQVVTP